MIYYKLFISCFEYWSVPGRGPPAAAHVPGTMILHHTFFLETGFTFTCISPLSNRLRPPHTRSAARKMPRPHNARPRPVQNCINRRDAAQHFITLYQTFKLTTSCPWYLLSSNALLKSKGRRMATRLSRRGLKIPRMYILDLTFTNMCRITGEKKACG